MVTVIEFTPYHPLGLLFLLPSPVMKQVSLGIFSVSKLAKSCELLPILTTCDLLPILTTSYPLDVRILQVVNGYHIVCWTCSWNLQRSICKVCTKPHCPTVISREVNHESFHGHHFSNLPRKPRAIFFPIHEHQWIHKFFLVVAFTALNAIPLPTEIMALK